jgi:hypothetical protein
MKQSCLNFEISIPTWNMILTSYGFGAGFHESLISLTL